MELAYLLTSSTPVLKRYKASAAQAVGTLVLKPAAGASGQMTTSTTTGFAKSLGHILDNGNNAGSPFTYSTTQGDPEAVFTVVVNPDQVLRAQMVTGATGTAVTSDTIATATSNGLTTIGGSSVASPDMDEGTVWYLSGANVGRSRKIVSTSSVTATVVVPFAANAIGDVFCYAGVQIGVAGVTLTTDLKKVRTDIAIATGGAASVIDLELNGTTDSYVHLCLTDMAWNN